MTSKEALIKLILDDFTPANDLVYRRKMLGETIMIAEPQYLGASPQDCYNIIGKDLEVLEILKHLINDLEATFNRKEFSESAIMGTIIKDYFINNDITGKVEEWLEK